MKSNLKIFNGFDEELIVLNYYLYKLIKHIMFLILYKFDPWVQVIHKPMFATNVKGTSPTAN